MTRLIRLPYAALVFVLFISGCTDFVEPNQLAFVMGTAIDHAENGNIEVSHQIVIPSQLNGSSKEGGSGSSESFIVMSAKGKNVFDATQKIQKEMSRRLMTSHRILIAISEEFFNKNDASNLLDKMGRDPANNQRDIILMIKGDKAKEVLMIKHPMESISSIAAGKELHINRMRKFSTRQYAIDSISEESRSLVPILQIINYRLSQKKADPMAVLSGYAVLNKQLKVNGSLDDLEGSAVAWMSGKASTQGITIPWKDGKGSLSFRLTHLQRQIQSVSGKDPNRVKIAVKAQAYLIENTTGLDMSDVVNIVAVQKYLNEYVQKDLKSTMDKVQRWGSDVFGIGAYLHHHYPAWWRSQKSDWDENFKHIDITLQTKIHMRSVGVTGGQIK